MPFRCALITLVALILMRPDFAGASEQLPSLAVPSWFQTKVRGPGAASAALDSATPGPYQREAGDRGMVMVGSLCTGLASSSLAKRSIELCLEHIPDHNVDYPICGSGLNN
ncbi:MAG: hypothetical protein NVS3B27_12850 [Novosphingobium sp.]